ncbi:unnamed protein product [Protopolystoma xenopodis]|uniref:Uncharacterized protein n=1 Tax=Protopolystoma xenopodis TaxID=117903 RepID=A0A448X4X1_9PLAT|nr:unnamed protein product [Protopolystoma xenopodis]
MCIFSLWYMLALCWGPEEEVEEIKLQARRQVDLKMAQLLRSCELELRDGMTSDCICRMVMMEHINCAGVKRRKAQSNRPLLCHPFTYLK